MARAPTSIHPLRPTAAQCLADWRALVRANGEQTERLREEPEDGDFYAPVASAFRADPDRTDDPSLNALLALTQPGETWLDVGAGGGRYALAVARRVAQVIAMEPSEGMRQVLTETARTFGITNVALIPERWPPARPPTSEVAVITHVGYDVEEIGPFLEALERSARRLCIAMLMEQAPGSHLASMWEAVHGEPRATLPALPEFLTLLWAWGALPEVRIVDRRRWTAESREEAERMCRRWLWLREGSAKDAEMRRRLDGVIRRGADGGYAFTAPPSPIGLVTWAPSHGRRAAAGGGG